MTTKIKIFAFLFTFFIFSFAIAAEEVKMKPDNSSQQVTNGFIEKKNEINKNEQEKNKNKDEEKKKKEKPVRQVPLSGTWISENGGVLEFSSLDKMGRKLNTRLYHKSIGELFFQIPGGALNQKMKEPLVVKDITVLLHQTNIQELALARDDKNHIGVKIGSSVVVFWKESDDIGYMGGNYFNPYEVIGTWYLPKGAFWLTIDDFTLSTEDGVIGQISGYFVEAKTKKIETKSKKKKTVKKSITFHQKICFSDVKVKQHSDFGSFSVDFNLPGVMNYIGHFYQTFTPKSDRLLSLQSYDTERKSVFMINMSIDEPKKKAEKMKSYGEEIIVPQYVGKNMPITINESVGCNNRN